MKKILLGTIVLAALALVSCGRVSKEEYQQVQSTNDSLMIVALQQGNEIADLSGTLNALSEQLDKINGQLSMSNGEDQDLISQRDRILQKLNTVQQTIIDKQRQLDELQKKYGAQLSQNKELKKTIERLRGEVVGYQQQIEGYRTQLAQREQQIASLSDTLANTQQQLEQTVEQTVQQQQVIGAQDKMLNTGYYVVADKGTLKGLGLIEGGLFSAKRLTTKGFSTEGFTEIDIRAFEQLPLGVKSVNILSSHPDNSYELQKDNDKMLTLVIKDKSAFWSNSRFLVVML